MSFLIQKSMKISNFLLKIKVCLGFGTDVF